MYIEKIPKPLLDDLVQGKWLPMVGAGFSLNAFVSNSGRMPLWNDLGERLAAELEGYKYSGTLDAISSYGHEYGRPKLIERLSELLHAEKARPAEAHRAFCSMLFDIVCTTNFDFLLEKQYEGLGMICRPIIDEDHLSVNSKNEVIALLKLHGDLHHPNRLIVTEEDYDGFLNKYPLIATYLANLLISRTAVFVGYSVDDPDFRQIWHVIGERLGRSRRLAYAFMVDASPHDVARFARRGVKVINFEGSSHDYNTILAGVFTELQEYIQDNSVKEFKAVDNDPLAEIRLPKNAPNRLCFFSLPLSLQPLYREFVFPEVERLGLVPTAATDIISMGDNLISKVGAIISHASVVVVDATSNSTIFELGIASNKILDKSKLIIVLERGAALPSYYEGYKYIIRENESDITSYRFIEELVGALRNVAESFNLELVREPERLLHLGHYKASVISAYSLFEAELRKRLPAPTGQPSREPLYRLAHKALVEEWVSGDISENIKDWTIIRNKILHHNEHISESEARNMIASIMDAVRDLERIETQS